MYARYGAAFLLLEKDSKQPVAATVCVPPIAGFYKKTLWKSFRELLSLAWFGFPWLFRVDFGRLLAILQVESLHTSCADEMHWYVATFASHPNHQGKGYGKKLLLFLAELADVAQVQSYLEATGRRNVGFYSGVAGYQSKQQVVITSKDSTFDYFGGVHGMVRDPK